MITETKICSSCKIELPITSYWKDRSKPSGVRAYCKECSNTSSKAWQRQNNTRMTALNLQFRASRRGSGKCVVCKEDALKNRNVCKKHYVVDIAKASLGRADLQTVQILIEKFELNPFCIYTGEKLTLGINAHLDHILSRKNHPELKEDLDNVEWISEKANLAKNSMDKEEFIEFCKLIYSRF
ncbi:hypothetical protein [Chlorogloea sp. CCALA 695]